MLRKLLEVLLFNWTLSQRDQRNWCVYAEYVRYCQLMSYRVEETPRVRRGLDKSHLAIPTECADN